MSLIITCLELRGLKKKVLSNILIVELVETYQSAGFFNLLPLKILFYMPKCDEVPNYSPITSLEMQKALSLYQLKILKFSSKIHQWIGLGLASLYGSHFKGFPSVRQGLVHPNMDI